MESVFYTVGYAVEPSDDDTRFADVGDAEEYAQAMSMKEPDVFAVWDSVSHVPLCIAVEGRMFR